MIGPILNTPQKQDYFFPVYAPLTFLHNELYSSS